MDHGLSIEKRVTKDLLRLAGEMDIPLVATNDLHYTHESDAKAHEAPLAIQSGSKLIEPTYDQGGSRFAFSGSGYYLKTPAEMRALFREMPEACDNTLEIAEKCEVSFDTSANYMPKFPCPPGEDETSWLIKEVEKGLEYRYPDGIPDDVRKQADYELDIIISMGFPGYFLVVADFINWSKDNGIRVGPGRGSGAGSMVAYAMRITDLDPLQHGLFFERFLNPDRVSMPDFDVDFDDRRRGEVIEYVTRKYGDERVAMIVTYGTIKTKQALKDSARVLGKPFSLGERLTKALPPAEMAGHSARRHREPRVEAVQGGRGVPRIRRHRPRGEGDVRDGEGPRGTQAPVGRPRGRRHHVLGPDHRRHPDHAPLPGRPGHHPVRLPDLRGPRADQDGLPRSAEPHDHLRRRREHQSQPGLRPRSRTPGARRPGRLRTPHPRGHARRLPARRRRPARAAG